MGLQDPCDWALDICKKKVELWWAGVRNSMASKNQRWKKNRNKLFLWGLGCWHALQNTWTWKKTSPCFLLLFVFSVYYSNLKCTAFVKTWAHFASAVSWLPSNIHKLWPTIASSVGIRAKRFLAFLILETAGGHRVGNLHSGEKDFLNFRFILETAGPGGQVTRRTRWTRWTRRTRWSGDQAVRMCIQKKIPLLLDGLDGLASIWEALKILYLCQ